MKYLTKIAGLDSLQFVVRVLIVELGNSWLNQLHFGFHRFHGFHRFRGFHRFHGFHGFQLQHSGRFQLHPQYRDPD